MSVRVPVLDCCCMIESCSGDGPQQAVKKESYKKAVISLNRNEFSEVVLTVAVIDKG